MQIILDIYTPGHGIYHVTLTEDDIVRHVKHDLLETDSLTDDTEITIGKIEI